MKNDLSCIPTAKFANMCCTTKRTLIHYDEIGLFHPAGRLENDYRYYTQEQYETFECISALRSLGMPLEEIREYLNRRDPAVYRALLSIQEEKVQAALSELTRIQAMIRTRIGLIDESFRVAYDEVSFEGAPAEYLLLSQPINADDPYSSAGALFKHLFDCSHNTVSSGHPYGVMLTPESVRSGRFREFAYYFTKHNVSSDMLGLYEKPAGLYATLYMKGDYHYSDGAFNKLLSAIDAGSYTICGYSYKEGIIDSSAEKNFNSYVNKISIQVRKA